MGFWGAFFGDHSQYDWYQEESGSDQQHSRSESNMSGSGETVKVQIIATQSVLGSTEYVVIDNEGYGHKTLWGEKELDQKIYDKADNSNSKIIEVPKKLWDSTKETTHFEDGDQELKPVYYWT